MRHCLLLILLLTLSIQGFTQKSSVEKLLTMQRDSILTSLIHQDSIKVEKQFKEMQKWERLKTISQFPVINAGQFSGIIPVKDPTEIPDPNIEYKLLFELTSNNPDSTAKQINSGLTEVARIINLHVASGIPVRKIIPVIVVHGAALNALTNNQHYQANFKMDNPNIKVIEDLKSIGAKFVACGQAMAFYNLNREELLPGVRVSLTAQTVLSSHQLKGYVLYNLAEDKK